MKVSLPQSLPASQVDITSVINHQLLALVNQYCAFISDSQPWGSHSTVSDTVKRKSFPFFISIYLSYFDISTERIGQKWTKTFTKLINNLLTILYSQRRFNI